MSNRIHHNEKSNFIVINNAKGDRNRIAFLYADVLKSTQSCDG